MVLKIPSFFSSLPRTSPVDPVPCPDTHRYPFHDGLRCCKYYKRKYRPVENALLDGSDLLLADPEDFCFGDEKINCPIANLGGVCNKSSTAESECQARCIPNLISPT